jgi:hypothetical protein
VRLVREQEQDGVAAPLDDARSVVVRDREQLGERLVEDVVHLLGADLALLRQPLRQAREAGDVDEGERAVDLPVAEIGCNSHPFDGELRDVRLEPLGWRQNGGGRTGHLTRIRTEATTFKAP